MGRGGAGPDVPYPDGGLRNIRLAAQRTPTGYAVEVAIPLFNLEPLRADADGRIGFDLALNDVDSPGAIQAESYMTLSGGSTCTRFRSGSRASRSASRSPPRPRPPSRACR